jgi:hypothetical protein
MNPAQLLLPDGTLTKVLFCQDCGIMSNDEAQLERQCKCPRICRCGKVVEDRYCTKCRTCRQAKWEIELAEKERLRFEKATKLTEAEYDGPVFNDDIGWNNGYFRDTGELHDMFSDADLINDLTEGYPEDFNPPAYAWACHVRPICSLDLADILENACQEGPEDWDSADLDGTKELQAALDAFNELNKKQEVWTPDYKRVILLDLNTPRTTETPCPATT